MTAVTPKARGPKVIPGQPCPTCKVARLYASKLGAWRSGHKDCMSCANSKKAGGIGTAYDSEGRRLCNDCRLRPHKHNSLCQECAGKRMQNNYLQKYRFAKYGVTKAWFEERLTGKCEICSATVTERTAHIDHDHTNNIARGILCGLCNKGLGQFKDSLGNLKSAIVYLQKNNKK